MQAADLLTGDPGAGGVAGVGDEDQAGAVVHLRQQGVDVDAVVDLLGELHARPAGPRADGVGAEAELALDDVVAGFEEGLVQQLEDLVGAAAEDQPLGLQAILFGDGGPQDRGAAVGIHVQQVDGAGEGRLGVRAAAQDVLVGRQLQRMFDTLDLGLAGHIAGDVEDAGLRRGPLGLGAVEDGVGHGTLQAGVKPASYTSSGAGAAPITPERRPGARARRSSPA